MSILPIKDSIWYHFKHEQSKGINHMTHKVIGISIHTSSEVLMIVYQALYNVKDSGHKDRGEDFFTSAHLAKGRSSKIGKSRKCQNS